MHLHTLAMLGPLLTPDPTSAVCPRLLWTCPAQQCSIPSSHHRSGRTSSLRSQPHLPAGVRWTTVPAAAATAQMGTEQQALVGLGTAARELQGRDAHLDGLSDEQRAAVLAGPQHVRRALPRSAESTRRHSTHGLAQVQTRMQKAC